MKVSHPPTILIEFLLVMTLACIQNFWFLQLGQWILIPLEFIHCHSCVMFVMKSMSICNDEVNYNEIIIH